MKKILSIFFLICFFTPYAAANQFYPEFEKMKQMRCEIVETTFDSNDKEISTTGYYRLYRLDDENKLIYLQKNLIDRLGNYDDNKITFYEEMMTDDSIIRSSVEIDRKNMKYTSTSYIEYDNPDFGSQKSVGIGECKYL